MQRPGLEVFLLLSWSMHFSKTCKTRVYMTDLRIWQYDWW